MSGPGKVCCVLYCTQRSSSNNVSFHKVPSQTNKVMRLLWLKQIRRRDYIYKPADNIFVCSKHFRSTDYRSGVPSGRKYLKAGAIPSVFQWNFHNEIKSDDAYEERSISYEEKEDLEMIVKDTVNDLVTVVVSTEESITQSLGYCQCSNRITELETKIAELKRIVSIQDHKISIQNSKLKTFKKELLEAKKRADIAENHCNKMKPSLDRIKDNSDDLLFYTGLPNNDKLVALYNRLNPGPNGENLNLWNGGKAVQKPSPIGRPRKLGVKDQFLLVLMRLRLGLFLKDLADRFGISSSTASNYCISWINFMYFRLGKINIWPTREQIDATMPEDFKKDYPSTRVIIDATELKCQASKSLVLQSASYSNYKSTTTFKGLIGISPNGYVTFVSHLFTGSISDQEITRRSGFLNLKFSPNDSVMADKGFLIEGMLKEKGVILNIPPFLGEKGQFTKEELQKSQKIAALRIHVERRIARIRGFHILDRPIPLTLAPVINQLWTVIALLSNFQTPLIRNVASGAENEHSILTNVTDEIDNFQEEILYSASNSKNEHSILKSASYDSDDFQEEIVEPEIESLEDESAEWSDTDATKNEIPLINLDLSL